MKNFDINVAMPVPADSLDSDPQQVNQMRERLRRESQQRFEELASEDMLQRQDQ